MEDLSKLSYGELSGRVNAARVKAIRFDKIRHPDRDSALRELMELDAALKSKSTTTNTSATFPHYNTEL